MNKSIQTREDTIIAKEKEQIGLVWNSLTSDKTAGKILNIDEDNFENELNNSGNNTKVDYVDNNADNDFSVTFIDTTHEYIVDKNGDISLESTDIKIKVEQINFDAGCNLAELGFNYVNPYSTERNAALNAIKTVNGMRVFASWSNGYAYLQSIEKYDFSNIVKIEVGTDYSADTTSGLLTFSVGLASDGTTNTGFENDYKTTIQKTNQKKTYATMVEAQDVVELDTSKITGNYYLKFLSQHSSSPSAYTMGAKIFWIKIYSNK